MILLSEIQCFGSISFWIKSVHAKAVILEQHEKFQKSGYRNRYWVLGANGPLLLTIPILGGRGSREQIRDVQIDYFEPWQKQHRRTLESAYNKSPYFLFYRDYLEKMFLVRKTRFLWDFNCEALEWINGILKAQCNFQLSETFKKNAENEKVLDFRGIEKPSNRTSFAVAPYYQIFGNQFETNLSILDILFNAGPLTLEKLKNQK